MANASGDLQTQSSVVVATTERTINGTGALGVSSTVTGVSERTVPASGTPSTGSTSVSGVSRRILYASGVGQVSDSTVSGDADRGSNASGTPQAQASTIVGVTDRQIDVTGTPQAQSSSVAGVAEREVVAGTGAAQAGLSSTTTGTAVIIGRNAIVALQAQSSDVFGQAKAGIGGTGDLNPTSNHLVSGLGERVIDDQGGISLQPITDNLVTGLGERTVVLQQGIFSNSSDSEQSTLNGIAERALVAYADGALQPTTNNLVTGLGEREVEDNVFGTSDIAVNADASSVGGVAERTVVDITTAIQSSPSSTTGNGDVEGVGSGALTTGSSSITAVANIKRTTSGAFRPTTAHLVTGLAEREIDHNIQNQFLMSGDASVAGVSEREITGTGAFQQTSNSVVTGAGDYNLEATGVLQAQSSAVTGLGERTVNGTGELIHPDSKTRPPLNKAERIMVVSGLNGFFSSGQSSITANAHVGRVTSKDFRPNEENLVSGVAEREITVTGINMPDDVSQVTAVTEISKNVLSGIEQVDASVVAGVSERTVELESGLTQVGESVVAGVAERQIDLESGVAQVDASVVAGAAPRVITGTGAIQGTSVVDGLAEVINTASGALVQSTDSVVVGSGVRVVQTEPTGFANPGATANSPDVTYVSAFGSHNGFYYPKLSGMTNSDFDGIYNVSTGQAVAESGSDYIRSGSTSVNAYFKFRSSTEIDILVYNTTRSAWYASTISVSEFLSNSFSITDGALNQELVTSDSVTKQYGSEFDGVHAPDNLVSGVSERIVVDVDATLDTTPSLVTGTAERKSTANGLLVTDIAITAVANIGRITDPELQSGPSRVVAAAEDIHVDDDATPVADASVVAGVAEREVVLESGIEQVPDLSDVVGVAERTVNLFESPQAQPSTVAGVAERTVNLFESPRAQPSTVAGVAERQIDLDAGIAQVDASVVAGIAEREITGAGVIVDNSNVVNGVSEREMRTSAALRPTTDNLVTGIAERTINLFQSPQAQPSQVTGLSERQIDYVDGTAGQFPGPRPSLVVGLAERVVTLDSGLFSADSDVEQSTIIGLGERTINLVQGLIQDSDLEQSHTTGLAERIINLLQGIDMPDDESDVVGVAERIIVLEEGIDMPDDVSEVDGLAERIVVLEQGIIQDSDLEQSHVVGLSERTIVQTGGGALKPTDNNVVTAVSEREIEINEVTQELKPTDNNLVTGLAERIIVLEDGVLSNRFDSDQSHVVALLDSAPVLTIVRKPIEDAVEAGSSEVDTVDADRVIRQIPDGLGPDRLAPAASDPNVTYSGNLTLTLSGIVSPTDHNHDYTLLPQGFTVATSGFTDYVVTVNNTYNSYIKHHGPGNYHVVAYSTTANEWVVFETTSNGVLWTGGEVLSGSASNSREVATESENRNGPFKILELDEQSRVTGVAEREIEINDITQDLQSGPSTIVGAGFRTAVEEETPVQAQPSTLQTPTGSFAERIIEVDVRGQVDTSVISDPSTVSGVAERIIEQNEQNANLQGTSSSTGVAERIIGWQRGDLVVPTRSRVTGVGEREIENNGITQVLSNQFNPSQVAGVAERTINLFQGILSNTSDSEQSHTDNALFPSQGFRTSNLIVGIRSNDSDEQSSVLAGVIDGTGERVITNRPTELETTRSLVTGTAERTIELDVFGASDFDVQADPSTVTGVAERIVVLEKGVGIPSTEPVGNGPLLVAETDGEPTWNDWTINPYATPIPPGLPSIGSGTGAAVLEHAASYTRWGASFGNQGYYIDSTNGDLVIDAKDVFMNLQPYNVPGDRNSGTFVEVHQLPWDDFFSGTYERVGRYGWAGRSLDFDNWTAANQRRWGSRDSWPTVADADPGDNGFSTNHMAMSVIDNPVGAWMYGREHDSGLWMYIYFVQDSNRPTRGQWAWIRDVDVSPDSISAGVELDHVYTGGFSTKGWNDADHDSYGSLTDSLLYQYSEDENLVQRHGLSGWYGIGRVSTDELAYAELDGDTQNGRRIGTFDHAFPEGILNSIDLEYSVIEGTSQDSSVYFYGQDNGQDFRNDFSVDQFVNGYDAAPIPNIYGVPTGGDSNPEYAKIYHATDDAETTGVAERIITGSGVLVVDDPSVVVGVAEREIEINEITQELKPIEHNIVTGVAERIITVDEGIHSADEFKDEQSRVTAIVYTNNLEQSRIHTKRKFVLREERTKMFIVRQTPTG